MTATLVKGDVNLLISAHLEKILYSEYHGFLGITSGGPVLDVVLYRLQLSRDNQILEKVGNWSPINNLKKKW